MMCPQRGGRSVPRWAGLLTAGWLAVVAAGSATAQDAFEANLFTTPVETAEELTSIVPLNALNADAPPPPPAAGAADPSTAEPSGIPPSPAGESAEGFDPAVVAIGRAAFEARCLDCHDAEKSLQKRKTYAGWLATVRRMAAKADADIPEPTHVR
jgi:hypothetical protein